jgi:hypothetical protein
MEGDPSFVAALTTAVEQHGQHVEKNELPALREAFRALQASLQSLILVLLRKGLIQEDPYKQEQKISDIVMSEDSEFMESERDVVVGVRLSELDNVLEYANNYGDLSLKALDFVEIKKLGELARYISWDALATNSSKPTTRAVANILGQMQQRMDSLGSGILNASLTQLSSSTRDIAERLRRIRSFQRERYKLEFRQRVLESLPEGEELDPGDPEARKKLRSAFTEAGLTGPFVPELITEIWEEDHGDGAAERRAATLARLSGHGKSGRESARRAAGARDAIVDAVRALAQTSRYLDAIMERVRDNAAIIRSRKKSLGERFRDWIGRLVHKRAPRTIYSLEYLEETTGTRHREEVDLDEFLDLLQKKARTYAAITAKSGTLWKKIENAGDDQLYQYVNKELGTLHLIHRRTLAFDGFFKGQLTSNEKKRLRGIKIEASAIKNGIAKANSLKHEFASRREEQDQRRKLSAEAAGTTGDT